MITINVPKGIFIVHQWFTCEFCEILYYISPFIPFSEKRKDYTALELSVKTQYFPAKPIRKQYGLYLGNTKSNGVDPVIFERNPLELFLLYILIVQTEFCNSIILKSFQRNPDGNKSVKREPTSNFDNHMVVANLTDTPALIFHLSKDKSDFLTSFPTYIMLFINHYL